MSNGILVLLSTYNGEKYIGSQLRSILGQTTTEKISFLIRDDGSTDGTVDIIKRTLQTLSRKKCRFCEKFSEADIHCAGFGLLCVL